MPAIKPSRVPEPALLARYVRDGGYADCYATEVDGRVDIATQERVPRREK